MPIKFPLFYGFFTEVKFRRGVRCQKTLQLYIYVLKLILMILGSYDLIILYN